MKLETKELQELYDELMSASLTVSAYEESPVERAFKKYDELLQEHVRYDYLKKLQDRNNILEKANESLLSANIDLARENGKLERDLDTAKKQVEYFTQSRDNWRSRAKHEVEEAEKKHQELKEELDKLQQDHESDVRVIGKLHSQMVTLEDEKTEQAKRADILKSQRDLIRKALEELKRDKKLLTDSRDERSKRAIDNHKRIIEVEKELKEAKERLYKCNSDRVELQTDRDIWFQNNCEKQATIAELKKELDELQSRAHCAEDEVEELKKDKKRIHQSRIEWAEKAVEKSKKLEEAEEKIQKLKEDRNRYFGLYSELDGIRKDYDELTSQYQKLTIENKRLQKDIDISYEQGQTDLWDALQIINDINSEEFYDECESMDDVISMDLEDFLDCYKEWQEEKETERMRNWLADFCYERKCKGCPLGSDEFKCGRGYSFMGTRIIPDEDIKRYYEKALNDSCSGAREKIKDACDSFCNELKARLASEVKEVPVSCDIPIKDLASWGCTIEATVEINKDLLNKICGINSDD